MLQKELGPDRRISAKAEILDEDPASAKVDGGANPQYLGVWDSRDTWLTDEKLTAQKKSLAILDTYQHGRDPSLFRAWLVSHPLNQTFGWLFHLISFRWLNPNEV